MRHFVCAVVAIGSLAAFPALHAVADPASGRISESVELEKVEPLLKKVSRLFEKGFGRAEADAVARGIDALAADAQQSWQFAVTFEGRPMQLSIRARVDDLSMVDLDFNIDPSAAPRLTRVIDEFTT